MIRVLLADDHARFRGYLQALLEKQPRIALVGSAGDGQAAIDAVEELLRASGRVPDVVITDIRMHPLDGIEATRRLMALHPKLKVLGLTSHDDPALIGALIAAGARGCLLKGDPVPDLLHAIEEVAAGRRWFSPLLGQMFPDSPHSAD